MLDKMKQLMELKRQADQLKKELDAAHMDVSVTPGIKITINGAQNFESITLEENLLNPANKARLEQDLLRSLNAAIKSSQNMAAQKMKSMTGLNIPGL